MRSPVRVTQQESQVTPPYPGTPLWANVFGIIVIVVLLLFVVLMVTRGPGDRHGPDGRAPSGDAGARNSLSSITDVHRSDEGDR